MTIGVVNGVVSAANGIRQATLEGVDVTSIAGRERLNRFVAQQHVEGLTGEIRFNTNGDRNGKFAFYNIKPDEVRGSSIGNVAIYLIYYKCDAAKCVWD